MDGPQFDDLVRVLAVGSPRREALHVLVGGALGLLGWLGLDEASAHDLMAKCKKIKDKKKKKACVKKAKKHAAQHLSEGSSSSSSPDPCAGVTCPAISNGTAACQNGACVVASCQTGFTQCGNACVDVQLNPQHCGKCGVVCPGDDASRCVNGRCQKTFTTPGAHPYVAPSDGKVTVEAIGARGGNGGSGGNGNVSSGGAGGPGGAAGRVTATFDVAAGDSLQIDVGETGGDGFPGASFTLGGGGGMPRPVSVNGGAKGATGGNGAPGTGGGGGAGGNGGGASNVRHHGNRIVVAGGGGGGGGAGGGANGGGAGGTGGAGSGVAGGDSTSGGGAPGQGGRPASGPGGVGGFGGSGIGPVGSTFGTACCQPSPPDTCVGCSLANLSNGTTCCTEDARVTVTFTAA